MQRPLGILGQPQPPDSMPHAHAPSRAIPSAAALAVGSLLLGACATTSSPRAQVPAALREAVQIIQAQVLDADQKDWAAIERDITSRLGPVAEADAYRRAAIVALDDPHASYMTAAEVQAWQHASMAPAAPSADPASPEEPPREEAHPASRPAIPDLPWGLSLPGGVGYVGLPPCVSGDPDRLQEYGLALRRQISALAQAGATRWIVDLRLDGGGNVWPMLTGLAPLLGDGPATRSYWRAPDGRAGADDIWLQGDSAWLDRGNGRVLEFTLHADGPPVMVERDAIAVLLGPWTMSSGELTALAFVSRPFTRSFGEPTGGLTTVTNSFPLADGSVLVLPVAYMAAVLRTPNARSDQPRCARSIRGLANAR
ncbi:MAG: S41 family peptidase [Phycisphaerales bacterium]|nr:S41 family peptidase [Phycisphaerales bacterium]